MSGALDSYEELHFEVRIVRRIHERARYRRTCRCAEPVGIVTAPSPPKPIRKGRLSIGFLVRLVYYKFGLGLPASRVVALLGAEGAQFSCSSLVGALDQLGGLISALADAVRHHNAAGPHLHADETSWKVFVLLEGKTNRRWWLWVFVGKDSVAFSLTPLRGRDVVISCLGLEMPVPRYPHRLGRSDATGASSPRRLERPLSDRADPARAPPRLEDPRAFDAPSRCGLARGLRLRTGARRDLRRDRTVCRNDLQGGELGPCRQDHGSRQTRSEQ